MNVKLTREWMTAEVISVAPTAHASDAYRLMTERGVRRLPVVEGEALVGIVSLGDLREAEVRTDPSLAEMLTVALIMRAPVVSAAPDMPLKDVARLMLDKKIGGVPVVDGGRLVGMLSESDILRAFIADQG